MLFDEKANMIDLPGFGARRQDLEPHTAARITFSRRLLGTSWMVRSATEVFGLIEAIPLALGTSSDSSSGAPRGQRADEIRPVRLPSG